MTDATPLPAPPLTTACRDPRSPHYTALYVHDIGLSFNDKELRREEYCISDDGSKVRQAKR